MTLPVEVVSTDHQLEQVAEQASGQLARHRWHWTLDDTNPGRVSISEYAKAVTRTEQPIRVMVNGYAAWLDEQSFGTSPEHTLEEHTSRARMSGETRAAAAAVGKSRGISAKTAQEHRREEVKRVREWARDRAEQHGTTVEDEARHAAEQIVKQEQADARLAEERKARMGLRFVKAENILAAMYRRGQEALAEMRDVPWEDEHRELLTSSLANIKALLHLIDLALTGAADVDWDAEMAKLS